MPGVLRYVSRSAEGAAVGVAKAAGVSGVDNRMPGEKHALLRVNGKTVLANYMGPGTKLKSDFVVETNQSLTSIKFHLHMTSATCSPKQNRKSKKPIVCS